MTQIDTDQSFKFKQETFDILSSAFEVYNTLGSGFLENVYQKALSSEFSERKIPFVSEKNLQVFYKDRPLDVFYKADFICFDAVVVELKSVSKLINEHRAQLLNYLKATGLQVGLLLNFGHYPKLEYERIVR